MVILIVENDKDMKNALKESIKKKIRDELKAELKQELLDEIYKELVLEERLAPKDTGVDKSHEKSKKQAMPAKEIPATGKTGISITVRAVLKIASHALKYANKNIPKGEWVEVIGLLAGKLKANGSLLSIKDAYPMGHGNAIYAEIKDYKNFVRAFNDIKKKNLFICGWYHSHPSYGCFMSQEDIGTQARYQTLWDKSVALVIDPYEINGKSDGFEIFRANLDNYKWFSVPYEIEGNLDVKMLPKLVDFINPIIDGKAIFLEYDED